MLVVGIASGAILIILAMIFNIKNGIKNKDVGKVLFDKNGIAGLVFYIVILALIVGFLVNGQMFISLSISVTLIVVTFTINFI